MLRRDGSVTRVYYQIAFVTLLDIKGFPFQMNHIRKWFRISARPIVWFTFL